MRKELLVSLALLFLMPFISFGQEVPQEACYPSREGTLGIGAWFHHEMICAGLRHWPDEDRALEVDFCAPRWEERLSLFIRGVSKLYDGCILDLYMTGGLGIPVGGAIDWLSFEGSTGMEWCFPDIPQMVISLEAGVSLVWWRDWGWESETFIAGGVHFYFPKG